VGRIEGAAQHAGSQSGSRHPPECRGRQKLGRTSASPRFMMDARMPK
jgi:hypothetical protein